MEKKKKNNDNFAKGALIGGIAGLLGAAAIGLGGYFLSNVSKKGDCKDNSDTIDGNENKSKNCQNSSDNNVGIPIEPDDDTHHNFICPITQSIMKDPVITPYGITYERKAIEEWLSKHNEDPISKKPLSKPQLIPNYALKSAIEEYLSTKNRAPGYGEEHER